MYGVFDSFLGRDTWHTNHPNDEEQFFLALSEVVVRDDFNADAMKAYFWQKKGNAFGPAIVRWGRTADVVHGYLSALRKHGRS